MSSSVTRVTNLEMVDEMCDLEAYEPRIGRGLGVKRQRASRPVNHHHIPV